MTRRPRRTRRTRAILRRAARAAARRLLRAGRALVRARFARRPILALAILGVGLGLLSCVAPASFSTGRPTTADDRDRAWVPGEPLARVLVLENAPEAKLALDGVGRVGDAVVDGLAETVVKPSGGSGVLLAGFRPGASVGTLRVAAERSGTLKLNGKAYRGELTLSSNAGGLRAVNAVRLEDYLEGVIGREMPLNWPEEALRAQSIAARSYAVWHLKHASSAEDHDLKCDQRSQVYGGVDPTGRARAVAASTEGLVLAWEGRLFEAFFHSTCGGETIPASWAIPGAPEIPPLMGAPCGRCDASKHARWTREVPAAELAKALAPQGVVAPVSRIDLEWFPRAGFVRQVFVEHARGRATISAKAFRSALSLKSTCFEVASQDSSRLVLAGKGWGHGAGLCQWGAKGLAEDGLHAEAILARAYPGAVVLKLY